MYGENELHTGVGSPADLVLSIVTATSYVCSANRVDMAGQQLYRILGIRSEQPVCIYGRQTGCIRPSRTERHRRSRAERHRWSRETPGRTLCLIHGNQATEKCQSSKRQQILLEPHNQFDPRVQSVCSDTIGKCNTTKRSSMLQTTSSCCRTKITTFLLDTALTRTRESLEKLVNQVPEVTPQEHYGCFSAALMLDVGQPLTDLAVYTENGDEVTRWKSSGSGDDWKGRSALRLEVD